MPNTLRAKPNDKFAQARAAKNSPERVEAAKKKVSRGPKAAGPLRSADKYERAAKIRDEERVFNLVHAILSTWKKDSDANHPAAVVGIIKVSRRQVERSLHNLKNTRFTKIPSLINDVLVYSEIVAEFGQWVYVEHDSPDWIFVRLPDDSTQVVRANLHDKNDDKIISVALTSERLMPSLEEDDEEIEAQDFDDHINGCWSDDEEEEEEEEDK